MQKFGLLFVIANVLMKLFIGFGIWKIAMEQKVDNDIKSGKSNFDGLSLYLIKLINNEL